MSSRYESPIIAQHFSSKQSVALAYLMTVGSKALILMELNQIDDPAGCNLEGGDCRHSSIDRSSILKSFDEEEAIKRTMNRDAIVRNLETVIWSKPGIAVLKHGRNGEYRNINIRLKNGAHCNKRGVFLCWKSKFLLKKTFDCKGMSTTAIVGGHDEMKAPQVPILQLRNTDRVLEIQFSSSEVCDAFIAFINSLIEDLV